ncbi:MAG: HAMP domain-containing histidine kinase [Synergistaceae bacterium]|jgi:signal transduction histidine kinase|nr:HAMP domain-containing histidine kinase [Synergistaceae bacterium]
MVENRTLLPIEERGAFKRILLGILILLAGCTVLYFGNRYVAYMISRLQERSFGLMLFGSTLGVLVHGGQVILLLVAWGLIGRGIGYYFHRTELIAGLSFSSLGIWAVWTVFPLLSRNLVYTFPLNFYIVLLLFAIFQLLTLNIENWIDKAAAILLWVYSFQSLELLPMFSPDRLALSTLFRDMYRSNEDVAIASVAGTALFLSFMAGAMIATWILTRYSILLGQMRHSWESQSKRTKEEDTLLEVSMVDIRSLVHDLRNPLAAIKGIALMFRSEGHSASEKSDIMLKAANYMEHIIGEILHEDQQRLVPVQVFFDDLEKHICPFPWAEHVAVVIEPDSEQLSLSLNEIRFTRALLNILDNASRANRTAGTKDIDIHVRRNVQFLEIEVMDNGPGIQSSLYQKSGWGSTGLGLAFTRKVVTSHGGNIMLAHRADGINGASVLVSLPIVSTTDSPWG